MADYRQIDEIRGTLDRAVAHLCPDWLSASRDDLVQNAIGRLLDRVDGGEGNPAFSSSYLYRTAHSVLVDEIRRVRRRDETPLDDTYDTLASSAPPPDQMFDERALGRAIRECLGGMAENRRLAVALHLQGHTVPEIATRLGWRSKKTDNALYRGMADLRGCLAAKGYEP